MKPFLSTTDSGESHSIDRQKAENLPMQVLFYFYFFMMICLLESHSISYLILLVMLIHAWFRLTL